MSHFAFLQPCINSWADPACSGNDLMMTSQASEAWHVKKNVMHCMWSERGNSIRERRGTRKDSKEEDHDPQEVFPSGALYCYFRHTQSCPKLEPPSPPSLPIAPSDSVSTRVDTWQVTQAARPRHMTVTSSRSSYGNGFTTVRNNTKGDQWI